MMLLFVVALPGTAAHKKLSYPATNHPPTSKQSLRIMSRLPRVLSIVLALAVLGSVLSFSSISAPLSSSSSYVSLQLHSTTCSHDVNSSTISIRRQRPSTSLHIFGSKEEEEVEQSPRSAEETAEKYGLEAGLFQSLKSDNSGATAKSLLAKYGIAYLATSIPLAIISFAICYTLVDNGVDVAGLLAKVGINNVGDAGEKAGTFAIAYAAHKAASPIRFPPTVLLTPVVARLIGKEAVVEKEKVEEQGSD